MYAKCDSPECDKRGRLGDSVRTYVHSAPVAVTNMRLCYSCFEKLERRYRDNPSHTIKDKVHT